MSDHFYLKTHPFSLINNTRGNNWPVHSAIAELVDNAIDANASLIEVEVEKDSISIKDNGNGFTYKELLNAFETISAPPKDVDTTSIGRYNTGMKTASVRLGDKLTILTTTVIPKSGYSFYVDWRKVCNENEPIRNPIGFAVSFKHGTSITINELFQPDKRDKTNIRYHLSKIYCRHLRKGIVIKQDNEPILPLPKVTLINERTIEGQDYNIRYGFYDYDKALKSEWRVNDIVGVHIYYKDRLFHMSREQRTAVAIPYDKYYIEINTISAKYGPNVHKDGLIYLDDILTQKVISVITGNLKSDYSTMQSEEDKKLENELTKMFSDVARKRKRDNDGELLTEDGQGRKPNENPGQNNGTITPKDTGIQHINWNVGDKETTKHVIKSKECDFSKIKVLKGHSPDTYGYASVDAKTGAAYIRLDWETSEYASSLRKKKDKSSLFYLAISILAEEWVKQIDVKDTVQQFIFKHTKNLP